MMKAKRPNLLFLFTDQQRLETMACYGNDVIHMPNLNKLAEESVVFENPYCTQPVCTPARGSLMTGLWPHSHGATNNNIPLNADARCIPELLPPEVRSEYRTAYMGKWHLGDEVFAQHGFEEWVSTETYYEYFSEKRDKNRRCSYHHFLEDVGFAPARPLDGYIGFSRTFAAQMAERYGKPFFLGSHASEFIRQNQENPWILTVNFLEPHAPNQSCRDTQYDPDDVYLPENKNDFPDEKQPSFLRNESGEFVEHEVCSSERALRKYTAQYWGLNSLVDTHAGRILDALEATGQKENTIIVLTSDHGEMLGSHGLMHKGFMFKESVQVPMLVHLPGQKQQGRITGPVSQIDLVPSLLDLMGQAGAASDLPGKSLASISQKAASGEAVSAEGAASPCVIEWNPGKQICKADVRTIVTHQNERYSHYSNGEQELYDLANDPDETQNLAYEKENKDRINELQKQLRDWQEKTDDIAEPV